MAYKDIEKRRAKARESSRLYRERHPEKAKERCRGWYSRNIEKARRYEREKRCKERGITLEDFDRMMAEQDCACAICRAPLSEVPDSKTDSPHIDHCHDTGRVRGLLCNRCNRALGLLQDDRKILEAALRYLDG